MSEEEDIHETVTKPSNDLRLQNEMKTTTKKIREDNGRRGYNKENWGSSEMIKYAKYDMEKELTALIKENSLCDCEDCNTKKDKNKEK